MQTQLSTNIIKINWVAKPTLLKKIWVYLLIELLCINMLFQHFHKKKLTFNSISVYFYTIVLVNSLPCNWEWKQAPYNSGSWCTYIQNLVEEFSPWLLQGFQKPWDGGKMNVNISFRGFKVFFWWYMPLATNVLLALKWQQKLGDVLPLLWTSWQVTI
jgi:hypothetical protein